MLDSPYHADTTYDYFVPQTAGDVSPGSIVLVPFGRGNRRVSAVVVSVSDTTALDPTKVKPLDSVVRPSLLTPEMLSLCSFMKEHVLCTFGEAVRAVVPSGAFAKINEYYRAAKPDSGDLGERAQTVFSYVSARDRVSTDALRQEFGGDVTDALDGLVKAGLIEKLREASSSDGIKRCTVVTPALETARLRAIIAGTDAIKLRSDAHRAALEYIAASGGKIFADDVYEACPGIDRTKLRALEKKGIISLSEEEVSRDPYKNVKPDTRDPFPPLTEEQAHASEVLHSLYRSGEAKAALLHGVTGSGKTRVIMEIIRSVLADGKDAIVLVPEIALTPQTVSVFIDAFGDRVAVIHSALGTGERYDAWRRIRDGGADVVIGTRSAVFAPVEKLGLIVIDEEQEHTYKSDTDPKYLAHDIARKRCADTGSLMLLASATPSLGSYYKAKSGVYTLIEMKNRVGDAKLPEVVISDTRRELLSGSLSPYGRDLTDRLRTTVAQGKQAIIFLNRRGYSSVLTCRSCGETVKCPNCSVSLTYHIHSRFEEGEGEEYLRTRARSGTLTCHYCGYTVRVPETCPDCGSNHMLFMGYGTERAEEELEEKIPGSRVIRLDTDTTKKKMSHGEILSHFRAGDANVLLGTQIVTKGHDFPQVTLVGILNADASLYVDDFRAAERTFAMLTQVIGRAGRAGDPGVAVIQTQNPDSDVIRLAAAQDYATFFEREIRLRRALVFPPFCNIAVLTLTSRDEGILKAGAARLASMMHEMLTGEYSDVKTVVYGPFEAPIYRLQNNCRMRMVVKCKQNRRTREFLSAVLCEFGRKSPGRINLSVDVDPSSL